MSSKELPPTPGANGPNARDSQGRPCSQPAPRLHRQCRRAAWAGSQGTERDALGAAGDNGLSPKAGRPAATCAPSEGNSKTPHGAPACGQSNAPKSPAGEAVGTLAGHLKRPARPPNARDEPLPRARTNTHTHTHTHGEQGVAAQGVFCTKAILHDCKRFCHVKRPAWKSLLLRSFPR